MRANQQLSTLASLAILKVDLDEGRTDYLGYLEQFILHILYTKKPEIISDESICDLLLTEFGLKIPYRGVQLVLRRILKRGYLEKGEYFYKITSNLPHIDFSEKRSNAIRSIEAVYLDLIDFVKKDFSKEWGEEQTTIALTEFLSKFGIDFLRAYIFNTALPELKKTDPHNLYIISRYICHLRETCNPIFENIAVLVKGHMYANALLCPDLESIQKKFDKVRFYLDTKIILNLLNLQGSQLKSLSDELVFLIKKLNGTAAIFSHTAKEVFNILLFTENNYDNADLNNLILSEIRKNNIHKTDIILLRNNLNDRIKETGVEIQKTPNYDARFQISETELQQAVEEMIKYKNPKAMEFDINSVRSIYTLRKDSLPLRLEDTNAVFVTTNGILARAAYKVGLNHNSTKEVSSVIREPL